MKKMFFAIGLVIVCLCAFASKQDKPVTEDRNVSSSNERAMIESMQYGCYESLARIPITVYQLKFSCFPTEEEYYSLLEQYPWDIPKGTSSIKYKKPTDEFPGYFNLNFSPSIQRKFTLTNSMLPKDSDSPTYTTSSIKNYHLSKDDLVDYWVIQDVAQLLNFGNFVYTSQRGSLPTSIEEIESIMGLQRKSGVDLQSYGIQLKFHEKDPSKNQMERTYLTVRKDNYTPDLIVTYFLDDIWTTNSASPP